MARKNRQANQSSSFKRGQKARAPYDKVLIVCEDTKSSRYYIEDFVRYIGLSSANVMVIPGSGSAPINVVDTSIERATPIGTEPYDRIFCVIDRDTHSSFDSALKKLTAHSNSKKTKGIFKSIASYPSFEIWILLHYKYTRACFVSSKQVIQQIKLHGLDYEKANKHLFASTKPLIDKAVTNANKSYFAAMEEEEFNPSTQIHLLLGELKQIKRGG